MIDWKTPLRTINFHPEASTPLIKHVIRICKVLGTVPNLMVKITYSKTTILYFELDSKSGEFANG